MAISVQQPTDQSLSISVDEIRRRASASNPRALQNAANPLPGQDLGKEAFLKLLTVQLKNQDPLEPIKNEAFVAQLAQFSSLEQLQNINTTLTEGDSSRTTREAATLAAVSNNTAVSLIGRRVETRVDAVNLPDSGPANIAYTLEGAADRVTADITDELGGHVRTITLHPSGLQGLMLWDGRTDDGVRVRPAAYRISLSAQSGGQPVRAWSIATHEVTGVRTRDGSEPLLLFNGGSVPLSSISGIFTQR